VKPDMKTFLYGWVMFMIGAVVGVLIYELLPRLGVL
jgi:hypothetical protein